MPLSQFDQARIDQFFAEIEPFEPAYRFPTFRYIAVRCKNEWILCYGVLAFNLAVRKQTTPFQTEDISAGEIPLSQIAPSPRQFLQSLLSGGIEISGRNFAFPADHSGNHTAFNWAFDGAQNSRDRAGRAVVSGSNNYYPFVQQPLIQRQLRTSPAAFKSLSELAARYDMQFDQSMNLQVEIHAPAVSEITDNSSLSLGHAHIELRLAGPLEHNNVHLRIRGLSNDGHDVLLTEPSMIWKRDEIEDWTGVAEVPFPNGESITCILSSYQFIQHERVIAEPISLRDTLRFAYELFDPELTAFERVFEDRKIKNRDGRELETAVSALLSLTGFRVIAVDHLPGLEAAPDIVAADTRGNLLVIECTLSLPNAADKMGKLSGRLHAIRQALDDAGLGHIQTFAIMAVALPRVTINGYLDDAQKAGIVLWGREDLHQLRYRAATDMADNIFDSVQSEFELLNSLDT